MSVAVATAASVDLAVERWREFCRLNDSKITLDQVPYLFAHVLDEAVGKEREACARLREFVAMEARRLSDLADAMRNPGRHGGWEGAEKVAAAFDRAADRCRDAAAASR